MSRYVLLIVVILALFTLATIVTEWIECRWKNDQSIDSAMWLIADHCRSNNNCDGCKFNCDSKCFFHKSVPEDWVDEDEWN